MNKAVQIALDEFRAVNALSGEWCSFYADVELERITIKRGHRHTDKGLETEIVTKYYYEQDGEVKCLTQVHG